MTNEQARREFAERLAYWNSTYVPDSVKTYLQAMKLAIRALQQADRIRYFLQQDDAYEHPDRTVSRIREVLNGGDVPKIRAWNRRADNEND